MKKIDVKIDGLTNKQSELLCELRDKITKCVEYCKENESEGIDNLVRLCIAERIRETKEIRLLAPTVIKGEDIRAKIVGKVTGLYAFRLIKNVKQRQGMLDSLLTFLGGKHHKSDKLHVTKRPSHGLLKAIIREQS